MKKIITITGIAAVLALSGCAVPTNDVETGAEAPAPVEKVEPKEADYTPSNADYIAGLDLLSPGWTAYGDESDAIGVGSLICEGFATEGIEPTVHMTWESADDNGVPGEVANAMVISAANNLCPEYHTDFAEWLNAAESA